MDAKKIKAVAFDLDGTLTQHKQPLSPENRATLDRLGERYCLVMVGAGQVMRIFNQMGKYPIDIIGNYGLQYGEYDKATGEMKIVRDVTFPCDSERMEKATTALRNKYGFTEFAGKNVEFHPSGCVTIPLLGTDARIEDKLAFDPDRSRRRRIYPEVVEEFSDYNVFVGGSSSFDMSPKPYDKYYALDLFCKERGFDHDSVVFVGDDYGEGGNDESVYKSDFNFITIDDYTTFPEVVAELLK